MPKFCLQICIFKIKANIKIINLKQISSFGNIMNVLMFEK